MIVNAMGLRTTMEQCDDVQDVYHNGILPKA